MKDVTSMSLEEFMVIFARCETVTEEFKACRDLKEKLALLSMVLDTIAYTENISHEELYKIIDKIKPAIEGVNGMLGKKGVIE